MDNPIFYSDYCCYFDKGQADLVISFSSVDLPARKFSTSRALNEVNANLLLVNCPRNSWYINSVFETTTNWKENILEIKKIVSKVTRKGSRVICYGGSMGGYGALLYGLHLNADYIFATGVEHLFFIEGGNTKRFFKDRVNYSIPDIHEAAKEFKGKALLVYGELFIPDILCANDLKGISNLDIVTLKNKPHSLPPFFHNKYGLQNIINEILESGSFEIEPNEIGDVLNSTDTDKIMYLYNAYLEVKRDKFSDHTFNKLKSLLEDTSIASKSFKGLCLKFLGIYHYRLGETEKSEQYLLGSLDQGLICSELYAFLSYIYKTKKDLKSSLVYSAKAINMKPLVSNKLANTHLKNLIDSKLFTQAEQLVLSGIPFNDAEAFFTISRLYSQLGNIDLSIEYSTKAHDKAPNNRKYAEWNASTISRKD